MTKLGMLYKIRSFISHETALLIYKSMIRPYMDYGDFIIDSAHISKVDKLDRLQDRILRLIEYCPVKEHRHDINVLSSLYNIDSLKTRRKRALLNLMYDQSRDDNNVYVNSCNIKLRSSKKLKLKSQFTRLTKVQRSPFYRGLEIWNSLPDVLQNEPSKARFKSEIKKFQFS